MFPRLPRPTQDHGFIAVLFALATLGSFAVGGFIVDDAYIVLRYVRNILAGHGWVYNIGEHTVNGSTSALNTLVLTVFGGLLGDLLLAQKLLLAGAIGGTAAIWYTELRVKVGRLPAGLVAALVVAAPMPFATMGLESSLVLLCGSATIAAFGRGWLATAGVLYACTFLARGDGVLLGLPLALACWYRHRTLRASLAPAMRLFGTALLAVLPWLIYSWITFGSPVPHTLGAKLAQTGGGLWNGDTFFKWIPYYFAWLDWREVGCGPWPFAAVLVGGTVLAVRARQDLPAVQLGLGWCGLQVAAYCVMGVPRYHWYFTQLLFATTLAAGVVVLALWRRRALQPVAVGFCCVWLGVTTMDFQRLPAVHYPTYEKVARWINANTPTDASVAVMDIGLVGWRIGDRPVVDMCSLVHREGVARIAKGQSAWWLAREPDYVITHVPPRGGFEGAAMQRPEFEQWYELAARPGSGIQVFKRRGVAAAPR